MTTPMIARDDETLIPVSTQSDEALERVRAKLEALEPKDLSRLNIDPDVAAGRALAGAAAINALRPQIDRDCTVADLAAIRELEDRANALLAANARYRTTVVTPEQLAALGEEALQSRAVLSSVCAMLVSCNLLKQAQVPVLTGGHSYRFAATDTLALVMLLKEHWPRVGAKVPVTLEQIERARGVSETVVRMVNVRDQNPQRASDEADLRQRALTLVDQAYDEARRVVTFLRWHEGDADEMLPPLRTHVGPKHDANSAGDAGAGAGDGTAASGNGTTGATASNGASATQPQSVTQAQINEALKVFAPPVDPKTGVAPTVTVPRSKPFTDA